jgi:hypothetical protein
MSICACRPGTHEEGWQEKRCEACVKAELDAWGQVIAWHRNGDIVKRIREGNPR